MLEGGRRRYQETESNRCVEQRDVANGMGNILSLTVNDKEAATQRLLRTSGLRNQVGTV